MPDHFTRNPPPNELKRSPSAPSKSSPKSSKTPPTKIASAQAQILLQTARRTKSTDPRPASQFCDWPEPEIDPDDEKPARTPEPDLEPKVG